MSGVGPQGHDRPSPGQVTARVRRLMEEHWRDDRGYCVPNATAYPHLWLWDSCFHAIVWAYLEDRRALRELDATLHGLPGGMVPHMRYGDVPPDTWLGPLPQCSSLTQPPMFGHAARVLAARDLRPDDDTTARARRGLDWLWEHRRTERDLIYVVHPWEAGNDHSPRWDDWGAPGGTRHDYDRAARSAWNKQRMHDVTFHPDGAASWSTSFVACPAGFNAYVAFNMAELAAVSDDAVLRERSGRIADAMDAHLWDAEQRLWADQPLVGGGESVRTPVSDGVMGALVTGNEKHAREALSQLDDPHRFGAEFGPANVARDHPSYDPTMYWRGAAWPQLNYLFWVALRHWRDDAGAAALAERTVAAVAASGEAEYWNPETGGGLGAVPQSWAGLVCAMASW